MSARYTVRIGYVDNTYWDDGSRWTSQTFKFDKRADALAFAREVATNGCTVQGQNGELHVRPKRDQIHVERVSIRSVSWEDPP